MKSTTIAVTPETKKALDRMRKNLSEILETQVSYSYVIKHILHKCNEHYDGPAK